MDSSGLPATNTFFLVFKGMNFNFSVVSDSNIFFKMMLK